MTLDELIAARTAERERAYADGYNNGDPETNGEFACLELLAPAAHVFVDIGANEGLFTARAAELKPGLKILAFEPNPAHQEGLRRILAPVSGRLESVALADRTGSGVLNVHPERHQTASLSVRSRMSEAFRSRMTPVDVPIRRLDDYRDQLPADAPVFIKVDVEGHEMAVLRGADAVLEAPHAAVLLEHSFAWREAGESLLDCFQLFSRKGFEFHRLLPLGLEHVRFFTEDMEARQYCNYLAVRGFGVAERPAVELPTPYGSTVLRPFATSR